MPKPAPSKGYGDWFGPIKTHCLGHVCSVSKEMRQMAVEKVINSVFHSCTYLELLIHSLLTKSYTDTWPEEVHLLIVHPSGVRNTKYKLKKNPEPHFKKFGMGHKELLHLVTNKINWYMWSTCLKVYAFLLLRSTRLSWCSLPWNLSTQHLLNFHKKSCIYLHNNFLSSSTYIHTFATILFKLFLNCCFQFLQCTFFPYNRNRYHRLA